MANNLLQKGILSNDDSIFHANPEEIDSIITEQQAFKKVVTEHRTVHFCLIMIHIVLIFGINAHFMTILKDIMKETKFCMVLNPSSFSFFLAHCLIILLTSVISIRHSNKNNISIWFLEQIRKAYFVSMFFSVLMIVSMFGARYMCRIRHSLNFWSIFWALLAFMESTLLISYINYFTNELNDYGLLAISELQKTDNNQNPTSGRREKEKRIVPELHNDDSKGNIHDFSMTSITTV